MTRAHGADDREGPELVDGLVDLRTKEYLIGFRVLHRQSNGLNIKDFPGPVEGEPHTPQGLRTVPAQPARQRKQDREDVLALFELRLERLKQLFGGRRIVMRWKLLQETVDHFLSQVLLLPGEVQLNDPNRGQIARERPRVAITELHESGSVQLFHDDFADPLTGCRPLVLRRKCHVLLPGLDGPQVISLACQQVSGQGQGLAPGVWIRSQATNFCQKGQGLVEVAQFCIG